MPWQPKLLLMRGLRARRRPGVAPSSIVDRLDGSASALVQAFAAIAVLASAAIAAAGFRRFPAPFGNYLSSRMTIEQQSPEPSQLSATKMHRLGS
jgi:hypothetical protein